MRGLAWLLQTVQGSRDADRRRLRLVVSATRDAAHGRMRMMVVDEPCNLQTTDRHLRLRLVAGVRSNHTEWRHPRLADSAPIACDWHRSHLAPFVMLTLVICPAS